MRTQRNRWRGRMPFRQSRKLWTEPLKKQGRTGEPSLATMRNLLQLANKFHEEGRGKAEGSFTEQLRLQFRDWLKAKSLKWPFTITFEYRLYRHRIITVVMQGPSFFHNRLMGDGSKGFMLEGRVLSIDGVRPIPCSGMFAMTRIVGRFKQEFLALQAANPVIEEKGEDRQENQPAANSGL